MLPREHTCEILVKNVAAFCFCPKRLPKVKVKRFRLITLPKEILKQPSIDFIVLPFPPKKKKKNNKMYRLRRIGVPKSGWRI